MSEFEKLVDEFERTLRGRNGEVLHGPGFIDAKAALLAYVANLEATVQMCVKGAGDLGIEIAKLQQQLAAKDAEIAAAREALLMAANRLHLDYYPEPHSLTECDDTDPMLRALKAALNRESGGTDAVND